MHAVRTDRFTRSIAALRDLYPAPKTVVCISAHWMTQGTWVTRMAKPRTIHDFDGFPQELFDVRYPAPGSPETADLIRGIVQDPPIQADDHVWGLDHGAWAVLRHIYPDAKIPVVQLSLDIARPGRYHYQLGAGLRRLRDQGILIVGSGNIVHNLSKIRWEPDAPPYEWAIEYDELVRSRLVDRDDRAIAEDLAATPSGKLSVPTPEHYYPLLYALGAADPDERPRFVYEGIENGSISMRTMVFGA